MMDTAKIKVYNNKNCKVSKILKYCSGEDMNKNIGFVKALALVSQLGIAMALPIIGCIILGNFLDRKFNTGVIFLIIFLFLGVGTAFRNLFVLTSKVQNNQNKRKDS